MVVLMNSADIHTGIVECFRGNGSNRGCEKEVATYQKGTQQSQIPSL